MRVLTWTLRLAVFLFLLAFAAKNTQPAVLHFYFGLAWETPLVVLLLAFFIAGALLGLLALISTVLRQRRQILALRRQVPAGKREAIDQAGDLLPPQIDA